MKRFAMVVVLGAVLALGACSSDTGSSPADAGGDMCADVAATQQAFQDLKGFDLASGADGLRAALEGVRSSLQALEGSASAAMSAQVASVKTALASLATSIASLDPSDLGSAQAEIQPEVTALETAIGDLGDAAGAC